MPNKVKINIGAGGLGRPLAGEDHISGLLIYSTTLPSGFNNANRIKQIFSVSDAEALGITDTHIGETRATAANTITATGATGDVLTVRVQTADEVITLGSYTAVSGNSTTTLVASAVATAVNALTSTHGFSATASTSTVSFTAPAGTGLGANSYTFTNVYTGTISASTTTWAGGVASQIDLFHYHIAEYFRAQPKGNLYVGIYSATTVFDEVTTLQNFAEGKIRQVGVFTQSNFATAQVGYLQTQADNNEANYKPLEILLQANFSNVSDVTTLSDLHSLVGKNVSVCFGQDGGATGYQRWLATNKSVGCVGLALGSVAFSKVNESIAWPGKFNVSNGEMETLAFANGTKLTTVSDGTIDNVDDKGYVFPKKHIGLAGSYWSNPYTAVAVTSDYARIPNNRTMHKATRGLRAFLLPALASPVKVNTDGTLTEDVIGFFTSLCQRALDVMERDNEISAYSVVIDPTQNVLSSSEIVIAVKIVPVGTADTITVNVGFALSV